MKHSTYRIILGLLVYLLLPLVLVAAADSTSPLGTEIRISDPAPGVNSDTNLRAIAMDADGDAVVVMFDAFDPWTLRARLYDAAGQPKGPSFVVAEYGTGDLRGADVAMDADGDFVVVWGEGYARLYNANGTPKGDAFRYSTTNFSLIKEPVVAMDHNGNFAVVWLVATGTLGEAHWRVFHADGTPAANERVYVTMAGTPDVAMDADGDFVASWSESDARACTTSVRRFNELGAQQGDPIVIDACHATRLAMDNAGNFVVAWTAPDGGDTGIFARRYLANGQPNGAAFRVNTSTDAFQTGPVPAMNGSGAMIILWTWNYREQSWQYEAGRGLYAQRYNAAGQPVGVEFRVNSYPAGNPYEPAIALDDGGDWFAAWSSYMQDGSGYGVYGQFNQPTQPNVPILVSTYLNGRVGKLVYERGDILKYDPAGKVWSIYFDASAQKITANIGDFAVLPDGDLLLVLKQLRVLPGAGTVTPQDIVRFDVATNAYSLYFDGSDVGLTTTSEAIDALTVGPNDELWLSTSAGTKVPGLTAWDEDIIRFRPTSLGPNTAGTWSMVIKGGWYGQYHDLWSLWYDSTSPDPYLYMTFERAITLDQGNIRVPSTGVVRCRPYYPQGDSFSSCLSDLYWTAKGFPTLTKFDGLELLIDGN